MSVKSRMIAMNTNRFEPRLDVRSVLVSDRHHTHAVDPLSRSRGVADKVKTLAAKHPAIVVAAAVSFGIALGWLGKRR